MLNYKVVFKSITGPENPCQQMFQPECVNIVLAGVVAMPRPSPANPPMNNNIASLTTHNRCTFPS